MKKKSILISICLVLSVSFMQAYGQNHDTKSVQYKAVLGYYTPVFCGDQQVDYVTGEVMFHVIDHYKKGEWQWEIAQAKGEATGIYGEVFEIKEVDKYWIPVYGVLVWHYNMIGNWGHHYIGFLTYSYITGEMTVVKTVCN